MWLRRRYHLLGYSYTKINVFKSTRRGFSGIVVKYVRFAYILYFHLGQKNNA